MRKKLKKYQSNKETGETKRDATRVDASATKAEAKRAVVGRSKAEPPTPIDPIAPPKIIRKPIPSNSRNTIVNDPNKNINTNTRPVPKQPKETPPKVLLAKKGGSLKSKTSKKK